MHGCPSQALHGRYFGRPIFVDIREIARPLGRETPSSTIRSQMSRRAFAVSPKRNCRAATSRSAVARCGWQPARSSPGHHACRGAGSKRHRGRPAGRSASADKAGAVTATGRRFGAVLPQRIDLAALLAVESYRIDPDLEARSALLGTLSRNPLLQRILRLPRSYSDVAADGTEVVIPGYSGVSVWNVASGRQLGPAFGGGSRSASWPIRRTTGRSMKASSAPMIAGSWSTRQVKPLNCGIRCATGCSDRGGSRRLSRGSSASFSSPQEPQLSTARTGDMSFRPGGMPHTCSTPRLSGWSPGR